MSNIAITLFLDGLMALLLVVTIVYCGKLSHRIRVLQDSKGELAQLIRKFDATTERASASIIELQTVSKRVSETMKHKLDKANYLADDLAFMIEKGGKLADKMESGISSSRGKYREPARSEPEVRNRAAEAQRVRSPQDVQKALAGRGKSTSKTAASLASVLEKVSERKGGEEADAKTATTAARQSRRATPSVRMRSKAERELMDALKPGN